MNFGLKSEDYQTLKHLVFEPLLKAGFKIYVFGSRATGKHHPFSDLDVLLDSRNAAGTSLLNRVKEEIEEARFPIKVDFVLIENLAESYRDRVDSEKLEVKLEN